MKLIPKHNCKSLVGASHNTGKILCSVVEAVEVLLSVILSKSDKMRESRED